MISIGFAFTANGEILLFRVPPPFSFFVFLFDFFDRFVNLLNVREVKTISRQRQV